MFGPVIRARNRRCDVLSVAWDVIVCTCNILNVEYISRGFLCYVLRSIVNCPDISTRWWL
jgi:hypothetical protein